MSQIHSTQKQILSITLTAFFLVTLSGAFATTRATHGSAAEYCEYHQQRAHTDGGRVVKNGLIGGLFGAGIGAVGGAIGGSAGKGAGIGAGAGVAAGAGYTLYDEHKKKEAARAAYHECMVRHSS